MKNARLYVYVFGLTLLVIMVLGVGPAGAYSLVYPSAIGTYYATPSWDQTLECTKTTMYFNCPRFILLLNMNKQAVLDKETGLVWEQSPDGENRYTWEDAQEYCNTLTTGGRMGWRLPTIQELASLVDRSQSYPALPKGHPFSNVQSSYYWSATTATKNIGGAWVVNFSLGQLGYPGELNSYFVWCVRGGQGVDPQ